MLNRKSFDLIPIANYAKDYMQEFIDVQTRVENKEKIIRTTQWKKPPDVIVKINFDALGKKMVILVA